MNRTKKLTFFFYTPLKFTGHDHVHIFYLD